MFTGNIIDLASLGEGHMLPPIRQSHLEPQTSPLTLLRSIQSVPKALGTAEASAPTFVPTPRMN